MPLLTAPAPYRLLQADDNVVIDLHEPVTLTFALRYLNSFTKARFGSPETSRHTGARECKKGKAWLLRLSLQRGLRAPCLSCAVRVCVSAAPALRAVGGSGAL